VQIVLQVIEGEPSTLRCPITSGGEPVDIAADYPDLLTRLRVDSDDPVEAAPTIEDTNVIIVVIPPLTAEARAHWELRDDAADFTWLTATIEVDRDLVPQ
jgi:hypothetical protein